MVSGHAAHVQLERAVFEEAERIKLPSQGRSRVGEAQGGGFRSHAGHVADQHRIAPGIVRDVGGEIRAPRLGRAVPLPLIEQGGGAGGGDAERGAGPRGDCQALRLDRNGRWHEHSRVATVLVALPQLFVTSTE